MGCGTGAMKEEDGRETRGDGDRMCAWAEGCVRGGVQPGEDVGGSGIQVSGAACWVRYGGPGVVVFLLEGCATRAESNWS